MDYTYAELIPKPEEPFHAWARRIMEMKGLHVTDMAQKINMSRPALSRILNGSSSRKDGGPSQHSKETVKQIAYALGVSENIAMMAAYDMLPAMTTIRDGIPYATSVTGETLLPNTDGIDIVTYLNNSNTRFSQLLDRFEAGIETNRALLQSFAVRFDLQNNT